MEKAILDFPKQFGYKPVVENEDKLERKSNIVLAGMGGSHLAADLLEIYDSSLVFKIHSDYGLPELSEERLKEHLFIASSYSGNTEETVDFAEKALEKKLPLAIIAIGGRLIDFAKGNNLPYIQMPDTGIQPRSALGFSLMALAKLIGKDRLCEDLAGLEDILKPESLKESGERLAEKLKGKVPVIYSSAKNQPIAYNWKIKFNETGKIPAFYNVFPELNHNEMTGYDYTEQSNGLSKHFHFIFVKDDQDYEKVQKRMSVCKKLYADRALPITEVELEGESVFERIFNSLILADWVAIKTADIYGAESEKVPMIEEFKKLIK